MPSRRPSPREYQVCFKCHTSYAFGATPPTSPSGGTETDAAAEFNPGNRSYHPVVGAPHLRVASATNLLAPWNTHHGGDADVLLRLPRQQRSHVRNRGRRAARVHNAYMLRFASATWSTTAPTLAAADRILLQLPQSRPTIRNANRVHGVGAHQSRPCQACHAAVPHGTVRVGLIALTTDPAPYNRGASRVVSFTPGSTPTNYSKSNCATSSGCH